MMKKIDFKTTIIAATNLLVCLLLLIFKTPKKVPLFFSLSEKIAVLGSKWLLLACVIVPTILWIFIQLTQKKEALNFFLKMMFYTCIFENMLIMIYVSSVDGFAIGTLSEIPMSLVYFLPLSAYIMLGGLKIKDLPFKAFSPFKNKLTTSAEFVWKQTNFYARNVMFSVGFISVILTLIFAIFRLLIVNIITTVLAIIIIYILVLKSAKQMSSKFNEMQAKKDKLDEEKAQKETK